MKLRIETASGAIQGFEENGLCKYLGIPYAEKPVGPLRFKRCVPVKPWKGTLNACQYGKPALQLSRNGAEGDEDCLTLNIVRPREGDILPVFVWIHGGGFMTGSAGDSLYSGESFARDGVVFVSIQYRLNVAGFFDFNTYAGCEDFETNRGLSDMATALQWIHANISAFGGDPNRVTIGGESAGGVAVLMLMATPSVRGCFQQVIAESALPNCVMTTQMARQNMDLYIEGMGLCKSDLPRLKTMPAAEMLSGMTRVTHGHQYKNPGIFLPGPVIDDLLPERPIDALRKGCAAGVRLIIGTNLHEGTMFVSPEHTNFPNSWEMIQEMFEKNGHAGDYERIRAYYSRRDFDRDFGSAFVHFATDYAFEMPSVKIADAQRHFAPTWKYRFEFLPESAKHNGMLVSHAFELPCVFDVPDHPFSHMFFEGESPETCRRIVDDLHKPWVNFIQTGEPLPGEWPCFAGYTGPVRIFDRQSRTEKMDLTEFMETWKDMRFYEN